MFRNSTSKKFRPTPGVWVDGLHWIQIMLTTFQIKDVTLWWLSIQKFFRFSSLVCRNDMRRASAIALLFLYLSANINLREFMRFPVLVEHFYEHKRSTREFNFVGFIVLHYFSGEVQDADYARHQELPFHDTPSDVTPMSIAITTEDSPVVPHVTEGTIQKLVTHSSPFFSSLAQFIILQPPKA